VAARGTRAASGRDAAHRRGRQVFILTASKDAEIEGIFGTLAGRRAGGLVVQGDILFTNRRNDFAALAARHAKAPCRMRAV
jgi:hypothetical protein